MIRPGASCVAAIAVALASIAARADAPTRTAAAPAAAPAPAPFHYRPPIPAPPPSPPDPAAAEQAVDANFDDDAPHHGFLASAAIGPAMQVGTGSIPHSSGRGPGVSLRVGAAATRRLALLFEISTTTYLLEVHGYDAMSKPTVTTTPNTSALLALGAQLYLRDAVWMRVGAGISGFSGGADGRRLFSGPGGSFGAGIDVVRRGHFSLSLELCLLGSIYAEGVVTGGFLAVGANYY